MSYSIYKQKKTRYDWKIKKVADGGKTDGFTGCVKELQTI